MEFYPSKICCASVQANFDIPLVKSPTCMTDILYFTSFFFSLMFYMHSSLLKQHCAQYFKPRNFTFTIINGFRVCKSKPYIYIFNPIFVTVIDNWMIQITCSFDSGTKLVIFLWRSQKSLNSCDVTTIPSAFLIASFPAFSPPIKRH